MRETLFDTGRRGGGQRGRRIRARRCAVDRRRGTGTFGRERLHRRLAEIRRGAAVQAVHEEAPEIAVSRPELLRRYAAGAETRRGELQAIWQRVPPRVRAWIGRRVAADWRAYVAAFDLDARPDDERLAALLLDWQVAEMLRCFGVRFLVERTPRPARVTEPGLFDLVSGGGATERSLMKAR